MKRFLQRYSSTFGFLALFIGAVILYLAFYGDKLFYTQTYYHLTKLVRPTIDIWFLIAGVALIANLSLFILMPNTEFAMLRKLRGSPRLRLVIGIAGLAVTGAISLFIITGQVYRVPWMVSILSRLPSFLMLLFIGGLGLVALYYALLPSSRFAKQWLSLTGRLAALAIALLTTVFLVALIELHVTRPQEKQVLSDATESPSESTHSVSVILDHYPSNLKPGDAKPIELLFRLTKYDANETAKRYPIKLASDHSYAVSANIRAVGLDISELPEELKKPRRVEIGEQLKWSWIVSAKAGREGTEQSLAVDVFLHDLTNNTLAFNAPITTLQVEVGTPLGLPTWLISPQLGIGAILGGLFSIFFPWVLGEISARRKGNDDKTKLVSP